MKLKHILYIFILFANLPAFAQNVLSGKIVDSTDSKPIAGASIYIPDIKIGTITDKDGVYTLEDIPRGKYLVVIHAGSYEVKTVSVSIEGKTTFNTSLNVSLNEGTEVVITGNAVGAAQERSPQAIVEVPNSYLMQNASTNIIDAISKVPGVSAITDGQSIAKPVIRGLGYNRVVTIIDGVPQQGQQWGDEFGIELDPYAVDRVEILKGPASLIYGSDAISGVLNFIPEETMSKGQTKADVIYNYQTNNGLIGTSGHAAGNNNGIAWSLRISNVMAHAYRNKYDGYVLNSQFSNFNTDGTIGVHRSWGFSQLHLSYFELQTGIVDGSRDSATGKLVRQALDPSGNPIYVIPTNQEYKSYTPFVINQLVRHYKAVWDNSIALGDGRIVARFAFQQNRRQENNDPTIPNTSDIYYFLNTVNYDIHYVSPDWHNSNISFGVNGMAENSINKGTLLLIPQYNLFDLGAFAIATKQIGKLNLSAGLRHDTRTFKGHDSYVDSTGAPVNSTDPAAIHRFSSYTSNFGGFSGSVGGTYQFSKKFYMKASASKGFRAPNVAETGSNGIHDGTVVYEIGTKDLKPESSLELDIAAGIKNKDITAELDVFSNSINNYIYPKQLLSKNGGDSVHNDVAGFPNAPTFKYTQGNAALGGFEAVVDIHPSALGWLDWYTTFSTVNAHLKNTPDSTKYLPFIPPARLTSTLTFNVKKISNTFMNAYFRVGMLHSFEQKNVYQQSQIYFALPPEEAQASISPTKAYTLFNAGIGSDVMSEGRKVFSFFISVDNLADVAYMDYMSRFKYYPVNFATNPYRVGVYNMGRNISFKVYIPLNFKKS